MLIVGLGAGAGGGGGFTRAAAADGGGGGGGGSGAMVRALFPRSILRDKIYINVGSGGAAGATGGGTPAGDGGNRVDLCRSISRYDREFLYLRSGATGYIAVTPARARRWSPPVRLERDLSAATAT